VQACPHDCGRDQALQLARETAPLLLDSARLALQAGPRRRTQERHPWGHPLKVHPISGDGTAGDLIECPGKDLSANGIGFYLPRTLPTLQVCVHLPATATTPAAAVPASIVRVQPCPDGSYEVGALFLPPNLRHGALAGPCPLLTGGELQVD
jgi:hypothetical protein